jgi:nucleoid DNA-binding protein
MTLRFSRPETIEAIKQELGDSASKDLISKVITSYDKVVATALVQGNTVQTKLGVYQLYQTKSTFRRDPRTGDPIHVPAKNRVRYTPNAKLRQEVESLPVQDTELVAA